MGVDIAESFITACNERKRETGAVNTEFRVATFENLPQEEFDVVICCEVLEHVIDLDASICAIDHCVRPGGHVLITVPHYNADGTWWGRLLRLLGVRNFVPMTQFSLKDIRSHGDAHVREFTRRAMAAEFEKVGYVTKQLFTVSHLDGPAGDWIQDGILFRIPVMRPVLITLEHILRVLFPGLGRHVVLLAQKPSSSPVR